MLCGLCVGECVIVECLFILCFTICLHIPVVYAILSNRFLPIPNAPSVIKDNLYPALQALQLRLWQPNMILFVPT